MATKKLIQSKKFLEGIFKAEINSLIKSGTNRDKAVDFVKDIAEKFRQPKLKLEE